MAPQQEHDVGSHRRGHGAVEDKFYVVSEKVYMYRDLYSHLSTAKPFGHFFIILIVW